MIAGKINEFSLEKRYIRRDGTVVWVTFTNQRRVSADGSDEHLSTVADITALKRVQTELRAADPLLKTLVNLNCPADYQAALLRAGLCEPRYGER